ncbi:G-type lectin S-receptor-like serine/threonine-protein kinase RLK1 [Ziziphus jujuba]|uniref:Receptor-like serine/threonine-protein kinase n=1 Tax=Ziziphus jujuba TaxID=326968 RepID=A0ABM3ZU50_ZIZJJ|nr:G-type lectin S-receptor-like serine/threonine-protein kinase RLK1 [Ziziphus jujuba]
MHNLLGKDQLVCSFLVVLPFSTVVAQNNANIDVGLSLTAGDNDARWLSPSEDFAFGFHQLENGNFLLAIWYYKLTNQQTTFVWYANGENNSAPRGSKLELYSDRGLVLKDPRGTQLWSTSGEIAAGSSVFYAVMNDTGNFQLLDENSNPLWQSFEHPMDTLLPGQIMEIDGNLTSRKGENDFSSGRFVLRMLPDGNAVLNTINLPSKNSYDAYYISGTNDDANQSNRGLRVVYNTSGDLYVLRGNREREIILSEGSISTSDNYRRVTLNFDGVLTLSYHSKEPSSSWDTIAYIPDDNICEKISGEKGTGPCGYNSICSIQSNGRPSCKCPKGYSFFDPTDAFSGCKPDFLTNYCASDSPFEEYSLERIPNTDWPTSDYELITPYDQQSCQNSCLHECLCGAAIFRNNSCWKKKLPLSNGRDGLSEFMAFLKVGRNSSSKIPRPPGTTPPRDAKDQDNLVIVLSSLFGTSAFANLILVAAICSILFFNYKKNKKLLGISPRETCVESNLRQFTYKELTEATNGFKEELGRGSCGIVYKGETESSVLVAVKKLDKVFQDSHKEFKVEVNVIGQTHHKNLVRLIGYCEENQHRLLVYEFLSNGTLARFLFGDCKPSWTQRIQIAHGIARGLVYLHEECSTQIIHCDIKPQNILLDEYYNARISDFGLAKLLLLDQSHTKTNVRGTKGYVAPDWFRSAKVSVKVDVYSFGVILLEIICCRRNVDMEIGGGVRGILTDWAYDCYADGKLDALIEDDMEAMNDIKRVERFVKVAIWCLQEDPNIRPTMKKVMLMLEGIVQVSVPPSPCSFTSVN